MLTLERVESLKRFIETTLIKYVDKNNTKMINASRCIKRYFVNNNLLEYYNDLICVEVEKNVNIVPLLDKIKYVLLQNVDIEMIDFIKNNLMLDNDEILEIEATV